MNANRYSLYFCFLTSISIIFFFNVCHSALLVMYFPMYLCQLYHGDWGRSYVFLTFPIFYGPRIFSLISTLDIITFLEKSVGLHDDNILDLSCFLILSFLSTLRFYDLLNSQWLEHEIVSMNCIWEFRTRWWNWMSVWSWRRHCLTSLVSGLNIGSLHFPRLL